MNRFAILCFVLATVTQCRAAEKFVPMFNGSDLTGWTNVNCAPETWTAHGDTVRCTGFPTGALRTTRMYENFVLELEWRHLKSGGNAGLFIWAGPIGAQGVPFLRAVEVQVLDHGYITPNLNKSYTTHGDVFPIHGSTMKPFPPNRGQRSFPSERHGKGSPEWNHYRVEANDGTLWLWVNGHKVSGGENCSWRKGYIALESEGSPVEFRNVRNYELPATGATRAQTADEAEGHRSLYSGVDLRGWKGSNRWRAADWQLQYAGGVGRDILRSDESFENVEFIVDCKSADPKSASGEIVVRGAVVSLDLLRTGGATDAAVLKRAVRGFHRLKIWVRDRILTVHVNGMRVLVRELPADLPASGPIELVGGKEAFALSGLYVRELN